MDRSAYLARKEQKFIRHLTKGVLSERDLLLSYAVGEFFSEMSLFIEEGEDEKKAHDAMMAKIKRS